MENKLYRLDLDQAACCYSNYKEYYEANEAVQIKYNFVSTDTNYDFRLDGEPVKFHGDSRGIYIEFMMPDHDAKLTMTATNNMVKCLLDEKDELDTTVLFNVDQLTMLKTPECWTCANCGQENDGAFCLECGSPKVVK